MKKILIIILFLIVTLLVLFMPNINNEYTKNGRLYINEVMSNNNSFVDNYNEYSDYIEIYNGYNYDINLEGYYLSDSEFDTTKWQFPDISINPNEYLIIYASGKDTCDLITRICHTNFNISSKGEILTLFDKNGNIVSKLKIPELDDDKSYGYINGKYQIMDMPTPNKENSNEKLEIVNEKYNLKINEYMTHNKIHYDEFGNYSDWVEIYNDSDKEVILNNVYISDSINELTKYKIAITNIKPYGYLIIYLNKEDSFGLSDNDKNIVISNGKDIIDVVDIVKLEDNISYGKTENGWKYFTNPTPGYVNNTKPFDTIGGNNGNS